MEITGDKHVDNALIVSLFVLVMTVVVRMIFQNAPAQDAYASRILVQNASEYYDAYKQDTDMKQRICHAAMAVANINAARQIYNDEDIGLCTGMDAHALSKDLNETFHEILKTCHISNRKQ